MPTVKNYIDDKKNRGDLVRPKGVSEEQWKVALQIYNSARRQGDKFPELAVAQAALETGWFKSPIEGFNYFGQKATKSQKGTDVTTHEYIDGTKIKLRDKFRAYDNLDEALADRVRLWSSKYKGAETASEAIEKISKKYATDPNYTKKVNTIVSMIGVNPTAPKKNTPYEMPDSARPKQVWNAMTGRYEEADYRNENDYGQREPYVTPTEDVTQIATIPNREEISIQTPTDQVTVKQDATNLEKSEDNGTFAYTPVQHTRTGVGLPPVKEDKDSQEKKTEKTSKEKEALLQRQKEQNFLKDYLDGVAQQQVEAERNKRQREEQETVQQQTRRPSVLEQYQQISTFLQNPIFQEGGKSPIYVEDRNDPRYEAYIDSLRAHIKSMNLKNSIVGDNVFNVYSPALTSEGEYVHWEDMEIPINAENIYNKYGFAADKIWAEDGRNIEDRSNPNVSNRNFKVVATYKKPEQRVIVGKEPQEEPKINLDTDIVAYLQSNNVPASFKDRKNLFKNVFPNEAYKGTAEQNIKLLNNIRSTNNSRQFPVEIVKQSNTNRHFQYSYYDDKGNYVRKDFIDNTKGRKEYEAAKSKRRFKIIDPRNFTNQSGYAHSEDRFNVKFKQGGQIPPGYHVMPDGTLMRDEDHVPVSSNGLIDYPNQEVIVPTQDGRISMKGINYSVLGTDEFGNQILMQPEGEYQFTGKTITEVPLKNG